MKRYTTEKKFYITSRKSGRSQISGFDKADAIEFAEIRVVQVGGEL